MGQTVSPTEQEITFTADGAELKGILAVPPKPRGIVIFAHGSGSSRLSRRNNYVARVLQNHNIGTLLMDLLTEDEAEDRSFVFDIDLLAKRLSQAKAWVKARPATSGLAVGYFGASTGAGAALVAAANDPKNIFAVVSRGGRPDLAGNALPRVKAPTLLIVGGNDDVVIGLNEQAYAALRCTKELQIIEGATHLFEEPGTLEQAARLAAEWFESHSDRS